MKFCIELECLDRNCKCVTSKHEVDVETDYSDETFMNADLSGRYDKIPFPWKDLSTFFNDELKLTDLERSYAMICSETIADDFVLIVKNPWIKNEYAMNGENIFSQTFLAQALA